MNKNLLKILILVVFISIIALVSFYQNKQPKVEVATKVQENIEVIAQNLNIPWEIAFLPNGEILVTERSGTLLLVKSGQKIPIEGVKHIGEGGLLGAAIHPNFENNKYIYLYYTYSSDGNETLNRVVRFKFENGKLINETVLVDKIPGAVNHNGGRIKFGPDKFLYISIGDAQNPSLAQDKNSLAGKILRVTDEGKTAPGNPFNNLVYSYGHRNPQGLAWDNQGRLWATEHGPQAVDELNLIEKGKNYGWPTIQGDQIQEGMVNPVIQSGSTVTWAPAGATYLGESIFFGGLAGKSLFEYKIADKTLKRYFQEEFGRIRAVVLGPDGYLYITTSNTDGRGNPKEDDDKLIKVNPNTFFKKDISSNLFIENLRTRKYEGGEIKIEETLTKEGNYTSYIFSYPSDNLKIYGMMNVPAGDGPFPVIILNHGYFNRSSFKSGDGTNGMADILAAKGYITLASDYRGFGKSEDVSDQTSKGHRPEYAIDVLNLIASVKSLPKADVSKIGMWGHSMGGEVSLRVAVATDRLKAIVLWAPTSANTVDNANFYSRRHAPNTSPTQSSNSAVDGSSPTNFLKYVKAPISLHQGLADTEVKPEWSKNLNEALKKENKTVEYFKYEGQDHNFKNLGWDVISQRTIDFFDKYVKGGVLYK